MTADNTALSQTEALGTADPADRSSSRLTASELTVGYGADPIIEGLNLQIPDAAVTTIIGPNGCGKSTLLRSMARLLRPSNGAVLLDGTDISARKTKEVARILGLLPQNPIAPDGLTVLDLVSRGRHPHQSWLRQWSAADDEAVSEAMELTSISDLSQRPVDSLSGGQRQRVWIAMALAQRTDLILLDEPTTYLDLSHAVDVLDLVDDLRNVHGKTVVMVLHDLNLAVRYSDWIVVMRAGEVVAQGKPADVITPELLLDTFGLHSRVIGDPVSGGPLIVPVGRRDR